MKQTKRPRGTGSLFVQRNAWYGQWWIGGRQVRRKVGPLRNPGTREGLTKTQAEALIFECRTLRANSLDQLMALDKLYAGRLDAAKILLLHDKIANDYANQGVAAEGEEVVVPAQGWGIEQATPDRGQPPLSPGSRRAAVLPEAGRRCGGAISIARTGRRSGRQPGPIDLAVRAQGEGVHGHP